MTALVATVAVLALAGLVWLGASVLGLALTIVLLAVLVVGLLVLASARLARSTAETRRWGHQTVTTPDGSQVLVDARRTEFQQAVDAAVKADEEWDGTHSPEDANLIAARRHGRIEREVSR